ncbi:probable serine/threonine-protein kinase pats1 [Antedon mediterranea]|uniref:probable serine/threonine-protein kinase pats1 n=1 Tax=Antedon mediterranea TaxID=105859 RepID=UPI003AF6B1FC
MKINKFLKAFKGKPYEGHVVFKYYAIDNSIRSPLDEFIVELRDHITEVAKNEPYMGEKMLLKWLNFLHEIEKLRAQNEHSITFKQVTKLASQCHITRQDQLFAMLHFHHDLGNIVYYGERDTPDSALNDIIIIIPQWLIFIFKLVITVKDPSDQKLLEKKLDEEGLLEVRLLRRMWQDFLEKVEALLELMQKFDLLYDRLFYVPSLLKENDGDEMVLLDKLTKLKTAAVLYVDFDGFLPEGLYYRLVVRIVLWSQQRKLDEGYNPRLFYQQVKVYIDHNHDAIFRILPERRSCIQIVVYRLKVGHEQLEPSPSVCKEVLELIATNLQDIGQKWMKRVVFTTVFCPCNVCSIEKVHLHKLEECLESTPRYGPDDEMDTRKIRRLFGKKEENPACEDTAQDNLNVPGYLRYLIGIYKDIPSPILPFDIMTEVCVLLDPKNIADYNDWRGVACKVGYDRYINHLDTTMNSPTMCVMYEWCEKGLSLEAFKACMNDMNRNDVVRLIDEYLTNKEV